MKAFAFAPLRPADALAVQEFVRALSLESRRERFFSPIAELSPGQLERIVSGPGLSLAAWRDARIAGLAQYALGEGPAEFAVVVGEDWRGLGLGEELVRLLIADARRAGVRTLGGLTMERNRPMRRLAAKLGFVQKPDADPDLVHMERALAGA